MKLPPINLTSNPSSSASSNAGSDFFDGGGGAYTGPITFQPGGGGMLNGLMQQIIVGIIVALAAKYLWGKLR